MMEMKDVTEVLKEGGVNPTPVRILVYKCLRDSLVPLSLTEMETRLESVDKSTISRTLSVFREQNLVYSFNDGSGSVKYELTHPLEEEGENDLHVHFRCEKCGVTVCLSSIKIPEVKLPEGFIKKEANYVITGICDKCVGVQRR